MFYKDLAGHASRTDRRERTSPKNDWTAANERECKGLLGIVEAPEFMEGYSDLSLRSGLRKKLRSGFRKNGYFKDDTSLRFFTNSMIRPAT